MNEESVEELQACGPPDILPPTSTTQVAAVEPGPTWEAPADVTETRPPLDEKPTVEPAVSLPVSQGQSLKDGSNGTIFGMGSIRIGTLPSALSPLAQLVPAVTQRIPGLLCEVQTTTLTLPEQPKSFSSVLG